MFGTGSTQPYDRARKILEGIAPTLRRVGQRVSVTGHTAAMRPGEKPEGPPWELSAGRATRVRDILGAAGVPDDRFAYVAGKADGEPMFPDNPWLAANRRVAHEIIGCDSWSSGAGYRAGQRIALNREITAVFVANDQMSLGVLHALADMGETTILGVVSNVADPYAPPAIDVVNTYYGRPDIPIGLTDRPYYAEAYPYWREHDPRFIEDMALNFPHDTPMDGSRPARERSGSRHRGQDRRSASIPSRRSRSREGRRRTSRSASPGATRSSA